jgi:hypothetical protein
MKTRAALLLLVICIVLSPLIDCVTITSRAQAVRAIPTRIDATKTPPDITIKASSNPVVDSGDFNGDGVDDFLVRYAVRAGSVTFIKFGIIFGKRNQDRPLVIDLSTDSPDLSLTTSVNGPGAISGIAKLGDLNGDALDDIALIHIILHGSSPSDYIIKVFFGSSSLSPGTLDLDTLQPDLRINTTKALVFAFDLVGAADLNADGIKDLVLVENNPGTRCAVPIIFGPFFSGETIDLSDSSSRKPNVTIRSGSENQPIGSPLLADVNGDGVTDILIKKPRESGIIFFPIEDLAVVLGSPSLGSNAEILLDDAHVDAILGATINASAITTGDVNGDGSDDVVIGTGSIFSEPAPLPWTAGEAAVWFGSRSLRGRVLQRDAVLAGLPEPADLVPIPGVPLGDKFGQSAAVRDIDGDAVADIIIGAPGLTAMGSMVAPLSRVYVILGSTAIIKGTGVLAGREQHDIGISFGSETEFMGIASRVGSGDFNGDGFGDILVGSWHDARVFFGGRLRPPQISKAKYRAAARELVITGTDLTGAARVEINGMVVDREVSCVPAENRLFLEGSKSELNLHDGKNRVVVVRKGARSNTIKVKL